MTVTSALGGLLFGYDTGVIAGALLFIHRDLQLSALGESAVTSVLLLGCMVGAGMSGTLAGRWGRRPVILAAGAIFAVGALGSGLAPNAGALVAARLILGTAVGLASSIVPLYLAEVSPPAQRGKLVSLNQLMVAIGQVLAFSVNLALAPIGAWRAMLAIAVVPAVLLMLGMATLPETPRWLVGAGRVREAQRVLERTREPREAAAELDEIGRARHESGPTRLRDLAAPRLRPTLFVGLGLAVAQMACGGSALQTFVPTLMSQAGLTTAGSLLSSLGVGTISLVFTVISMSTVDHWGRRNLLLTGSVAMAVCLALLALNSAVSGPPLVSVVLILAYMAAFAVSLAPLVWLMLSEIFPLRVRATAVSLATVVVWATNFVTTATFLPLTDAIGHVGVFAVYAAVCALCAIFSARYVPETKGRSLEQIEHALRGTRAPATDTADLCR